VNVKKIKIFINYHLNFDLKIKFTFRKDLKLATKLLLLTTAETALLGDRRRSGCVQRYKTDPGDRDAML
jgi:hypothetical protein